MLNRMKGRLKRMFACPPPSPAPKPFFKPAEFSEQDAEMVKYVRGNRLTMCGVENLYTTILACRYAVEQGIPGDFVECGVWRGGHALLAAYVFKACDPGRKVILYDTFAGMTEPDDSDLRFEDGFHAKGRFEADRREDHNAWCYASLEEVRANFDQAGLMSSSVQFVKGPVEDTLVPGRSAVTDSIESLAVLRLDTDWYSSTKKELQTFWPKLSSGGICIIDDLGYWKGCKKAVDEYFTGRKPFWAIVDISARLTIKA